MAEIGCVEAGSGEVGIEQEQSAEALAGEVEFGEEPFLVVHRGGLGHKLEVFPSFGVLGAVVFEGPVAR